MYFFLDVIYSIFQALSFEKLIVSFWVHFDRLFIKANLSVLYIKFPFALKYPSLCLQFITLFSWDIFDELYSLKSKKYFVIFQFFWIFDKFWDFFKAFVFNIFYFIN